MDIKVTSTGKIFYRIDTGVAALLCEALPSVFEPVAPRPGRPVAANAESASIANHDLPVWSVIKTPSGRYAIQCDYKRGQYFYDGSAEGAAAFKVGPHVVPLEIADRYFQLKQRPSDEALMEAAQERQQNAAADIAFKGGATQPKAE